MQFKSITVIAVLLLVAVSLLVPGCTNSNTGTLPSTSPYVTSTTPTYTPTSSAKTPTSSANRDISSTTAYANQMTTNFESKYDSTKAVVIQPFTYKMVNGLHTFTAVVKDGSSKLQVWNRTITYTLANNRSEARALFEQAKTTATSQGYGNVISGDTYWKALSGGTWAEPVGIKEVAIHICQPGYLCGEDYWLTFDNYYAVATEYMTRIE